MSVYKIELKSLSNIDFNFRRDILISFFYAIIVICVLQVLDLWYQNGSQLKNCNLFLVDEDCLSWTIQLAYFTICTKLLDQFSLVFFANDPN